MREPRRFWSKVEVGEPGECWEWLAGKQTRGYGAFGIPRGKNQPWKMWLAHRVAWILTYGKIPEGLCVLHKCDNPSCCNPYHLFLGTLADNVADAVRKKRHARGEKVGSSRLTPKEVLDIREMYAIGEKTQQELADDYGVSNPTICHIVNQTTWSWLKERK